MNTIQHVTTRDMSRINKQRSACGRTEGRGPVPEQLALSFAGLLRRMRADAGLTQEELAEAASISPRTVSDLERGINRTARKDTARLLADALGLSRSARVLFVAAACGRAPVADALAALDEASAGGAAVAATRTLSRDIGSFVGRAAEMAQLVAAVMDAAGSSGVVSVYVIGGMAGVGDTTLALHEAHQLAESLPRTVSSSSRCMRTHRRDCQWHRPMHSPSLLLTAGIGANEIPPGLQARAAWWRGNAAGKKTLLVLDDAASHDQVAPLFPGAGGSVVLVTGVGACPHFKTR